MEGTKKIGYAMTLILCAGLLYGGNAQYVAASLILLMNVIGWCLISFICFMDIDAVKRIYKTSYSDVIFASIESAILIHVGFEFLAIAVFALCACIYFICCNRIKQDEAQP